MVPVALVVRITLLVPTKKITPIDPFNKPRNLATTRAWHQVVPTFLDLCGAAMEYDTL